MKTVTINDIQDLIRELLSFTNHYVFRGQSVSEWKLTPALERIISSEKWNAETVERMEEYSLNKFTSRFHLYDRENKLPVSKLEWLSLMQHYGVPTRLLDFSSSPFLALYFAMENTTFESSSDCAVYAIDYRGVMNESLRIANSHDTALALDYHMVTREKKDLFDEVVISHSIDVVWVTEPQQLNARLDRQEGSFLISGNKGFRLEELLFSKTYSTCDIVKIIISSKLFSQVYALLNRVNINSRTVYGDLQGFGKSLGMEMAYYAQ